ncbi:aldehyde dehydrogenase family protein [Streptomyces caelestis]|jgi:acyl-CoA reductase-like NAD-dependent aldehyde dehydrogenase|uniref:aldehyde dehydrogenase family protein n=1 Tax=Streptomyces caelestis TaxID=36816 RepID=UPI0036FAD81C
MSTHSVMPVRELPFIGGAPREPHSSVTFEAVNPANGEMLAHVADCDAVDVDRAVQAAGEAQREWMSWDAGRRIAVLLRWADAVEQQRAELGETDTRNMGRVLREALGDGAASARMIRYWAGQVDRMTGHQVPANSGHLSYTTREPLGVIGVIMPWNGPVGSFCSRVAPAIACGNAAVVKPSEMSPLSALRLAVLLSEAGAPEGLVNVVTGGGVTGAAVAEHPGIGGVTFTGSVPTGRRIAHAAAETFKKTVLELGGKSPNIVFEDADLDAAGRGALWGVFNNAGQVCVAGTRLLVQRSIAPEFIEQLRRRAARIRVGDPMDPKTHMGPLASQQQFERVSNYLRIARDEGARVLSGGGTPKDTHPEGLFVEPTVLTEVSQSMRVAREEIFGPILSVLVFDDEDEAVALANDVEYGLSANIWTRDLGRMHRMAGLVQAGTIWGNTMRLHHPGLWFGGIKASGQGSAYAEGAIEGSTRVRRVTIRFDEAAPTPAWGDLDGD